MGIQLPPAVRDVFGVVGGMEWPEVDEDELWKLSEVWFTSSRDVYGLIDEVVAAATAALSAFEGEAAREFYTAVSEMVNGANGGPPLLEGLAVGCQELGDYLYEVALNVQYSKWIILGELIIIAAQVLYLLSVAAATLGASLTAIPSLLAMGQGFARHVVMLLVKAIIFGVVIEVGMDAVVQLAQIGEGRRTAFDQSMLSDSFVSGVIGGAIGFGFGFGRGMVGGKVGRMAGNPGYKLVTGAAAGAGEGYFSDGVSIWALSGDWQGADWRSATSGTFEGAADAVQDGSKGGPKALLESLGVPSSFPGLPGFGGNGNESGGSGAVTVAGTDSGGDARIRSWAHDDELTPPLTPPTTGGDRDQSGGSLLTDSTGLTPHTNGNGHGSATSGNGGTGHGPTGSGATKGNGQSGGHPLTGSITRRLQSDWPGHDRGEAVGGATYRTVWGEVGGSARDGNSVGPNDRYRVGGGRPASSQPAVPTPPGQPTAISGLLTGADPGKPSGSGGSDGYIAKKLIGVPAGTQSQFGSQGGTSLMKSGEVQGFVGPDSSDADRPSLATPTSVEPVSDIGADSFVATPTAETATGQTDYGFTGSAATQMPVPLGGGGSGGGPSPGGGRPGVPPRRGDHFGDSSETLSTDSDGDHLDGERHGAPDRPGAFWPEGDDALRSLTEEPPPIFRGNDAGRFDAAVDGRTPGNAGPLPNSYYTENRVTDNPAIDSQVPPDAIGFDSASRPNRRGRQNSAGRASGPAANDGINVDSVKESGRLNEASTSADRTDYFGLMVEGTPDHVVVGGRRVDAEALRALLKTLGYRLGRGVYLLSCSTGAGDSSIARQLSGWLDGDEVIAPSVPIWARKTARPDSNRILRFRDNANEVPTWYSFRGSSPRTVAEAPTNLRKLIDLTNPNIAQSQQQVSGPSTAQEIGDTGGPPSDRWKRLGSEDGQGHGDQSRSSKRSRFESEHRQADSENVWPAKRPRFASKDGQGDRGPSRPRDLAPARPPVSPTTRARNATPDPPRTAPLDPTPTPDTGPPTTHKPKPTHPAPTPRSPTPPTRDPTPTPGPPPPAPATTPTPLAAPSPPAPTSTSTPTTEPIPTTTPTPPLPTTAPRTPTTTSPGPTPRTQNTPTRNTTPPAPATTPAPNTAPDLATDRASESTPDRNSATKPPSESDVTNDAETSAGGDMSRATDESAIDSAEGNSRAVIAGGVDALVPYRGMDSGTPIRIGGERRRPSGLILPGAAIDRADASRSGGTAARDRVGGAPQPAPSVRASFFAAAINDPRVIGINRPEMMPFRAATNPVNSDSATPFSRFRIGGNYRPLQIRLIPFSEGPDARPQLFLALRSGPQFNALLGGFTPNWFAGLSFAWGGLDVSVRLAIPQNLNQLYRYFNPIQLFRDLRNPSQWPTLSGIRQIFSRHNWTVEEVSVKLKLELGNGLPYFSPNSNYEMTLGGFFADAALGVNWVKPEAGWQLDSLIPRAIKFLWGLSLVPFILSMPMMQNRLNPLFVPWVSLPSGLNNERTLWKRRIGRSAIAPDIELDDIETGRTEGEPRPVTVDAPANNPVERAENNPTTPPTAPQAEEKANPGGPGASGAKDSGTRPQPLPPDPPSFTGDTPPPGGTSVRESRNVGDSDADYPRGKIASLLNTANRPGGVVAVGPVEAHGTSGQQLATGSAGGQRKDPPTTVSEVAGQPFQGERHMIPRRRFKSESESQSKPGAPDQGDTLTST